MVLSTPLRTRATPPPNAVESTRMTPAIAAWWGVFLVALCISMVGMLIGILTHRLTQGGQILGFGVVSIVVLSLASGQIDRAKARVLREDANRIRKISKLRAAELDSNTPLTLTDQQLAWCHKSPTVGARLVALQRQRPGGVLLKRDMRELIELRLETLAQARKIQKSDGVLA